MSLNDLFDMPPAVELLFSAAYEFTCCKLPIFYGLIFCPIVPVSALGSPAPCELLFGLFYCLLANLF